MATKIDSQYATSKESSKQFSTFDVATPKEHLLEEMKSKPLHEKKKHIIE